MKNLGMERVPIARAKESKDSWKTKGVWERISGEAMEIFRESDKELLESVGEDAVEQKMKRILEAMKTSWAEELGNAEQTNVENIEHGKAQSLFEQTRSEFIN